jgi:uncharacterized protein YceK
MKMPLIFVITLAAILMSGCESWMVEASATERELCIQWGESLATRSRLDTEQTKVEIQESYARFSLACPAFDYLLPM